MKDQTTDAQRVKDLTRENLIWSALEGKLNAIGGYDAIICLHNRFQLPFWLPLSP
jgi:hypothetical protein